MAPTEELVARAVVCDFDGFCQRRSGWHFWGRWVVVGVCILAALLALTACICISRRNRRRGRPPIYGTGWFTGGNGNGNGITTGITNGGHASPPPYGQPESPHMTGTGFSPNNGYFSGQQSGLQYGQQYGMQPLQNAYRPNGY